MFNNPETIAIAMKIPSGICENSPRKGILKNELKKNKHLEIRLSSFSVCIKGYSKTCI